jgi:4-hydroxy-tetrahydrodipicolinate reductase
MKIGLHGYGKMGKAIERLHKGPVVPVEECEVCIDFSHADRVVECVKKACEVGCDLVIGTTSWEKDLPEVQELVEKGGIGVIYASNFSIGMALFVQLAEKAKALLSEYEVAGVEVHHSEKKDAPSGTAKMLGVPFESVRVGKVPGTHTLIFDSEVDTIELTHRARSRDGFARGALQAAEWVRGKRGLFTLDDMLAIMVTV